MRARVAAGVLAAAVALGGCAGPGPEDDQAQARATSLWSARTEFVGDSSRVSGLAGLAGFGQPGSYSLALQTTQPPYGMTVAFEHLDKPFEDVDLSPAATLMLGLVTNLDTVSVTSDGLSWSWSASDATAALGFDVKELGRDEARLVAYLDAARD